MLLPWRISKSKRFNLLSVTVMRLKLRSLYRIWQSSALAEPAPLSLSDGAKDSLLLLSPEFWVLRPESDADVFATHWGYAKRKRAIQTGKQSSRQIDQPTDRQGDRQADKQMRGRTDRQLKMYTPRYELLYVSATRESFWLLRSLPALASQICLGYGAWLCDVDTPDSISQLRGSLNKCVCRVLRHSLQCLKWRKN